MKWNFSLERGGLKKKFLKVYEMTSSMGKICKE